MLAVTTSIAFRTHAPFLVNNAWKWIAWNHREPNKHAAIIDKAAELGATSWDFGQADHAELDRWNHATRG